MLDGEWRQILRRAQALRKMRAPGPDPTVRQKWTLTQEAFDRLLDCLGPDRDAAGNPLSRDPPQSGPSLRMARMPYAGRIRRRNHQPMRAKDRRGRGDPGCRDLLYRHCAHAASGDEPRPSQQARPWRMRRSLACSPRNWKSIRNGACQCLRRCLDQLSPETRDLILHYYQGDKGDKIKKSQEPHGTLRHSGQHVTNEGPAGSRTLQLCAENCVARGPAEA